MDEAPEIEIRQIELDDYEAATELIKRDLGEYDALDYDENFSDLEPTRMNDVYDEPKGQFWVAVAEGAIVGTAALKRLDDRSCQMRRISVHPDFRRHDVAQRLLETAEDYAVELGFRRATAETTVKQKPAQVFFKTAGYSEFKRTLRGKTVVITYEKAL